MSDRAPHLEFYHLRRGLGTHARRLARECQSEANILQGGAITGLFACAACVYASMPEWAIAFGALGVMLQFVSATLRKDAKSLNRLADRYDP
jgi:hypothetical protein